MIRIAKFISAALLITALAQAQQIRNAVPDVARPLPLSAVRLTGGPLKVAQDLDADYLLKLEPDRMLAFYRKRAGLQAKAEPYGGWDGDGRNLTGHIAGHYLSGVSMMYAATGDARFKERVEYLVREMKEVQDKHGDGYLGALANGKEQFIEVSKGNIRSAGFDLNGLWSPWYVLHKTYAGLRDAYRYAGNRTALDLEIKFAAWAESIVGKLDDAQLQKMLNTEFGGMPEVLADLYVDTGDKRWLDLSHRFDHRAVLDPLARKEDILNGLHGNTQVPKIQGSLMRYAYTGDKRDGDAAQFFWEAVAKHHSFATGGHGKDEYFGPPDVLSDRIDGRTAETCNVYNMIKMSRKLFALHPDNQYAEFHERALFNHILGSIDNQDGRTCYMVPVGRGVQHEYADMFRSFTCCVGSGMESHALHGDGLYYESGDKLWVNLYAPSTAKWEAAGVDLTMDTAFPEGEAATLKLTLKAPKQFTLALRRPSWADAGFAVKLNGQPVKQLAQPGAYVELKRNWKSGDTVALTLPKKLRLEPLPDNPHVTAIMWGPLVLAGDLGPERARGRGPQAAGATQPLSIPSLVAADRQLNDWIKAVADKPGDFRTTGVGREQDVELVPFYRLHRRTYSIYFDLFTPAEWEKKAADLLAARERQRKLEAATLGFVQPGEMQPERDFNQQGEETQPVRTAGRAGRSAKKWFSFDLPVEPAHPLKLIATYHGEERATRTFEILVDGTRIGEQRIERHRPGSPTKSFFDVEYAVPAELVKDKQKVTVRFQAMGGNETAGVFGVRLVRAD
ncbi:MAG: glycoside hydrolase family 127 protein [Acidobacteria bacterium]|nr:glycoside hydrolase family 127 protein [Acidobacteriota bacterium]MBI3424819.1 glycoside hydrolase family 127 protein [Acidobacteriota bacterium]